MVDVKICYDRSTAWAGQAFHDLNVFSIRPNASTAVSMDMRDPLTHVTRTIADMPFFSGRIKSDRQLSKKSNGIATLSVLRSSLVCFAEPTGPGNVELRTAGIRLGISAPRLTLAVSAHATTGADRAATDTGGRFAAAMRVGDASGDGDNIATEAPGRGRPGP